MKNQGEIKIFLIFLFSMQQNIIERLLYMTDKQWCEQQNK